MGATFVLHLTFELTGPLWLKEWLGLALRRWLIVQRHLVKELPSVCAIQLADSHRGCELGIKVAQVDAMLRAWLDLDRLPVRDTPAGSATDRPQSSVALDVLGSVLRVPLNLDWAELEVDPRSTDATTKRAIARSSYSGRGRELQLDSAAMARTLMHGSALSRNAGTRGGGDCEAKLV